MGKLGESVAPAIEQTKAVKCEKCGCEVFVQALMLREVPEAMTGTGKVGIIPVPVFACNDCGHVNAQFLPEGLK